MSSELINLSSEFNFFFTFPFSLGFSIEYSPLPDCRSKLQSVATALNVTFPNYSWSVERFDEDSPLSLRVKGGFVMGKPKRPTPIKKGIDAAFSRELIGARFNGVVEESVVYFDHGVGSVNLVIHGTLEKVEAIGHLQQLAMAIIREIRKKEDALYIFDKWEFFREAVRKSFESCSVLYDMWGILVTGAEGRGPTRYVGENAILRIADESSFKIAIEQIPTLFAPFTGLKPEENVNLLPLTPGIVYLAEGWDGQIAVVSDPDRETWLMNLWQFATDYGAVLHDLDRYLYARTLDLRKEVKSINVARARREMDAIHRIELSIDVLTHEILPHNFGGIAEEIQVYRGIYDSWEMQKIVESLRNKFISLNTIFTNMNSMVSNSMQERTNTIMLIFTVLTLAGVLASVISTTDFNNIVLSSKLRLFIIIFVTIAAALLSASWIIIKRNKFRSRK